MATAQPTKSEFLVKYSFEKMKLFDEDQPEKQSEVNKVMVEELQQSEANKAMAEAAPSVQVRQGEEHDDQPPPLEHSDGEEIFDNHQQHDGHDESDDEDEPDDEKNSTKQPTSEEHL